MKCCKLLLIALIYFVCFIPAKSFAQKCHFPNFSIDHTTKKVIASALYHIADDDIKCHIGVGVFDSIYYAVVYYNLNLKNSLIFNDSKVIQLKTDIGNSYDIDIVSEKEMNTIFQKSSNDYVHYMVAKIDQELLAKLSEEKIVGVSFPFYSQLYSMDVPNKYAKKMRSNAKCLLELNKKLD